MHLFAEKIKKNTFLVVILSQFACSNAIFSERDYIHFCSQSTMKVYLLLNTMMCSTLTKMPFFIQHFLNKQTGHCDDVNKHHYMLLNSNVLKGS